MTLPPCWTPQDDEPADQSRRYFLLGSAVAIVAPLFIDAQPKTRLDPRTTANAVYHASGKRVRDLPITLEKLL